MIRMIIARLYYGLRAFILRPWVTWALIGINVLAGLVGGVYWYGPDMLNYAWWGWVFVPDCPLFTFLFAVALVGILLRKRWTWFYSLTAFGLIKYAIWTVTVWVIFWSAGFPATQESVLMTTAHIGMGLEGIMLMSFLPDLRWRHVVIAGAWFFLSDYMDYWQGFHPRMAPGVSESTMMWEMLLVSAALTVYLGWRVWRATRKTAAHEVKG
jgi:uncharacterized membrane protein YpjA